MPRNWSPELRPNVKEAMLGIGRAIKEHLPKNVGFVLLMFDFGEDGFMNYLSNADRKAMIISLKELVRVLEQGELPT